MKLHLAIVPLAAIIVVALLLAAPRPESQPHAPASGSVPAAVEAEARTGAPLSPSAVGTDATLPGDYFPAPASGGAPTPRPSTKPGDWSCSDPPLCGETPKPVAVDGIVGTATYYCRPGISRCTRGYPDGMYAAAGPEIRAMLGDWRGREVIVTDAIGNVAVVRLIDFCACGGDHVIDLYWTAFSGIVNPVTVTVP